MRTIVLNTKIGPNNPQGQVVVSNKHPTLDSTPLKDNFKGFNLDKACCPVIEQPLEKHWG
jgi:hypothetical protein